MRKLFLLALGVTLLLPASLLAQWRDHRHERRESAGRTGAVIADAENRSDDFRRALRRALDHSRLDGTWREDRLNDDAKDLANAMDRLRDSWSRHHDTDRARRHVRDAIDAARSINRAMQRFYLREHVEREWRILRDELNRLADAFGEPAIEWDRERRRYR
jgi:HAMP domain-containing protein